jgi:hypothetical protein
VNVPRLRVHSLPHRVSNSLRLLVDLFQHEVRIPRLLGRFAFPRDEGGGPLDRNAIQGAEGDPAGSQDRQLPLFQDQDVPGLPKKRRNVGGEEHFAIPEPDDQRGTPAADSHHRVRGVRGDAGHGIRAPEVPARPANCLREPVLPVVLNEVGDDLRVGLGSKAMPLCCQRPAEFAVVLNDPVVDEGEPGPAVHVGMGVGLGRASMGRPTRVADPERPKGSCRSDQGLERGDFPSRLPHLEPGRGHCGDAGRVVTPIFEAVEARNQERNGVTMTGVSDDAAHPTGSLRANRLPRNARQGSFAEGSRQKRLETRGLRGQDLPPRWSLGAVRTLRR